jgi:hypothetical protein
MNTYVLVSFWIMAAGQAIRLIELAVREEWPKEKRETLGMHLFSIILGLGFMFWAGYLLWWGV